MQQFCTKNRNASTIINRRNCIWQLELHKEAAIKHVLIHSSSAGRRPLRPRPLIEMPRSRREIKACRCLQTMLAIRALKGSTKPLQRPKWPKTLATHTSWCAPSARKPGRHRWTLTRVKHMIPVALTLRKSDQRVPSAWNCFRKTCCSVILHGKQFYICVNDNTNNFSQQCDRALAKKRKRWQKGKKKGKGKDCKGGAKIPERTGEPRSLRLEDEGYATLSQTRLDGREDRPKLFFASGIQTLSGAWVNLLHETTPDHKFKNRMVISEHPCHQ